MAETTELVRLSKHYPQPPVGPAPVEVEAWRSKRDAEGRFTWRCSLKFWGRVVGGMSGDDAARSDDIAEQLVLHKTLTFVCERFAEKVEKP